MDTIANLLTRIRNAKDAKHKYVDVPLSKMNRAIVEVLIEQGFLLNCLSNDEARKLRVFLKYTNNRQSIIQGLKRYSKPGLRRYIKSDDIPSIMEGLGIAVLSTSEGVMDGEKARSKKIGGELLCTIW